MRKIMIASISALGLAAVPAMAQQVSGAGTMGAGTATSTKDGSTATGGSMGATMSAQKAQRPMMKHKKRDGSTTTTPTAPTANSSTTYGSGTVYTDRKHATGGVTAGATATGTGDQAAGTDIDAYGSTDKSGSSGEVYGGSSASSTNTPPQN